MKKLNLLLVVSVVMILVVALSLTACRGSGGNDGQKLTIATLSVPSIDPQNFNAAPEYVAIKGYVEGLVHTWKGEINPGVAERWEIAEDNMTMTFYLRQDACWSDGSPLTAQDFLYAFHRLADPEEPKDYNWVLYEITNYADIADGILPKEDLGVEAPDDHTFIIHFDTPAPYYLGFLDMPCFYPTKKELVEKHGDRYASSADTAIGNGPFKLKEYRVDEKIVMVPNENYWNKDAIKLSEIEIVIVVDKQAAFSLFESGQVDWAHIPEDMYAKYLETPSAMPPDTTAYTYKSGAVDWFCINVGNTTNMILANQDFRLALNNALDREEYISIAFADLYSPATRFVLPTVSGLNKPYCEEYPINYFKTTAELAKAKEHLQKAMDAMEISDPGEISFTIKIGDNTPRAVGENCQDQWMRNLGIKVEVEVVPYKSMIQDRKDGNFDLVYAGWIPDFDDPYTYLGYFVTGNPQNGGKYSNPRYDTLVNTANTYTDPAKRLSMYAEAEELLIKEAGIVPLQVREISAAIRNDLKDFVHFYLGMEQDYIYAYFE
jgi:oligopeptide transport system substrate-binding protein